MKVPLIGQSFAIPPEWIDENSHMDTIHYKTLVDRTAPGLYEVVGLTPGYFEQTNSTVFQVEMHICYERELLLGDLVSVRSWVVGSDEKRLHHFHEVIHIAGGYRSATLELMSIHINRASRRPSPFGDEVRDRLTAIEAAFAAVGRPDRIGRRVSLNQHKNNSIVQSGRSSG